MFDAEIIYVHTIYTRRGKREWMRMFFSGEGDFCSAPTGHGITAALGVTNIEPLQGS